jgi:hypothetical protein
MPFSSKSQSAREWVIRVEAKSFNDAIGTLTDALYVTTFAVMII